jgi:hypothetical protein
MEMKNNKQQTIKAKLLWTIELVIEFVIYLIIWGLIIEKL